MWQKSQQTEVLQKFTNTMLLATTIMVKGQKIILNQKWVWVDLRSKYALNMEVYYLEVTQEGQTLRGLKKPSHTLQKTFTNTLFSPKPISIAVNIHQSHTFQFIRHKFLHNQILIREKLRKIYSFNGFQSWPSKMSKTLMLSLMDPVFPALVLNFQ